MIALDTLDSQPERRKRGTGLLLCAVNAHSVADAEARGYTNLGNLTDVTYEPDIQIERTATRVQGSISYDRTYARQHNRSYTLTPNEALRRLIHQLAYQLDPNAPAVLQPGELDPTVTYEQVTALAPRTPVLRGVFDIYIYAEPQQPEATPQPPILQEEDLIGALYIDRGLSLAADTEMSLTLRLAVEQPGRLAALYQSSPLPSADTVVAPDPVDSLMGYDDQPLIGYDGQPLIGYSSEPPAS